MWHTAPANVRGPGITAVNRGLAWWEDGVLYVASGMPATPDVVGYPTGDATPARIGNGWTVAGISVTGCGCSSPWKAIVPANIKPLAVMTDPVGV